MVDYPLPVPQGQSPPLAVVTENDHRAWIYITVLLGITWVLLSSGIRVFIRCSVQSGWGGDDVALGVSTILSWAQSAIVLVATAKGLGSSINNLSVTNQTTVQQYYYASNLLYILCVAASRLSVVLFIRRLTAFPLHIRCVNFLLGATVASTIPFFFAIALQCDLAQPWMIMNQGCSNGWLLRWEATEIAGAILEMNILAVAIWTLVLSVRMTLDKRLVVLTAFALRTVILLPVIVLRLSSLNAHGIRTDFSLHEARFICWTQSELNLSIIAATIPIAHRFLVTFVTHYGGAGGQTFSETAYVLSERQNSEGSDIHSFNPSKSRKSNHFREPSLKLRDDAVYSYGIGSNKQIRTGHDIAKSLDGDSFGSDESLKMIIRKDVSYRVQFGGSRNDVNRQ